MSGALAEAGGSRRCASVTEAARWFENLGTERAWSLLAQPIRTSKDVPCTQYGQGARRRIEHQCDGLGTRISRLGLLRIRVWRPR